MEKRWGDHGANPNGVYTGVRRVEWGKEEQRDGGGKPTKRETWYMMPNVTLQPRYSVCVVYRHTDLHIQYNLKNNSFWRHFTSSWKLHLSGYYTVETHTLSERERENFVHFSQLSTLRILMYLLEYDTVPVMDHHWVFDSVLVSWDLRTMGSSGWGQKSRISFSIVSLWLLTLG